MKLFLAAILAIGLAASATAQSKDLIEVTSIFILFKYF